MDIYICTDDVRVGRALALEAQAAGFSAAYGRDAADALLSVRDLDFTLPGGAPDGIAFSRDEERLRAAARHSANADTLFLLYPFDLALFRTQLRARLVTTAAPLPVSRALTLNTATRRVSGAGGEVRLSVRECAMLAALGRSGTLPRRTPPRCSAAPRAMWWMSTPAICARNSPPSSPARSSAPAAARGMPSRTA